ncbi:MAG: response regulator transcription factor [Campylobacterales bacterium]|nr:response regulator transcription factor [Campylobacterales bacterium]NQY53469.1 response regulator transcription factor [Campylobacteraceae bacterium]
MITKLLHRLKILIVEDEEKLSKLLKEAISDSFYSVSLAKDGIDGFNKFKTIKPDIIITDINMPFCDGLDMTIKIKEHNEDIPIIVLSAFSDKTKLLKAIDIGISKYYIKPFDPDELISYISTLAEKLNKKQIINLSNEYTFNNNSLSLYKNSSLVNLTKREKEFLYLLLQNQFELVTNEEIKKVLWVNEEVSSERLRTFIKRLRLKTSKDLIQNVSAQGYLISPL